MVMRAPDTTLKSTSEPLAQCSDIYMYKETIQSCHVLGSKNVKYIVSNAKKLKMSGEECIVKELIGIEMDNQAQ